MNSAVEKKNGFTIVELLVVIVVIGILAAITIVAYNGIQSRANNTAVESDLTTTAKKLELYKVVNNNVYPTAAEASLEPVGVKTTYEVYDVSGTGNFYYCALADQSNFALGAISKSGQHYYYYNGRIEKVTGVSGGATCNRVYGNTTNGQYGWRGYADTSGWREWTR